MSDTLQSDVYWMHKVGRMAHDRWLDGQRVQVRRPAGWSKNIDVAQLECDALCRQIREIYSTAEVIEPIEPEETDGRH